MNEIDKCLGCPTLYQSEVRADDQRQGILSVIDRKANLRATQLHTEDYLHTLLDLPATDDWIEAVGSVMDIAQSGLDDELELRSELLGFNKLGQEYTRSECNVGVLKYRAKMIGGRAISCGSPVATHQLSAEDLAELRPVVEQQPEAQAELQSQEFTSAN